MQKKIVFLEILTLEFANHIIFVRKFLGSLEWGKLIPMAICCFPSAQNTSWSLPTPTSTQAKNSWMNLRSKHWHLIDYIITRQLDLPNFLRPRARRANTDRIMIHFQTTSEAKNKERQKKKKTIRKLATAR